MGQPLLGLTEAQVERFLLGLEAYQLNFTAETGLGPGFNQTSCASCHNNPVGGPGAQMVTRFGRMDKKGGFDPLASLGGSLLQANALSETCQEFIPDSANVTSFRITPGTLGYGLVEAIPDVSLLAVRDTQAVSVRGVARMGTPIEGGDERVGRFGWKAQLATVMSFSVDASLQEIGITSALLPVENAPQGDWDNVLECDDVADPEDPIDAMGVSYTQRVTDFQRFLAAPPQMPRSGMTGESIFIAAGCSACHPASYTTADDPGLEDVLRNVAIKPYGDFLLHDMGSAADGIADGSADVREMRTPPLWGVRRRNPMWHDGRVGGGTFETRVIEAIELHGASGSQGIGAATAFNELSTADRMAMVSFLNSLGRAQFDGNGDDRVDLEDLHADGVGLVPCSMIDMVIEPDHPCAVNDVDEDGAVTMADAVYYAAALGAEAIDCDGDGVADVLQIFQDPAIDADQDGALDGCIPCPADVSGNGVVDTDDILAVLSAWGPCEDPECPGDADGDGEAGVNDILMIISGWGNCP
jgi:hypothetical protein